MASSKDHPTPVGLMGTTSTGSDVVLVTGGTGLIGYALQRVVERDEKLSAQKWVFLSSKDGNLVDRNACEAIFEKHQPTHCIHLAARVGGLFANMKYKVEFYRENVILNDNVMECCRLYKVKKLVSCLSTCIFPDKTTYPIDENMIHNGAPHTSNEGYAYAKRMIDVLNRCYNDEYDCNFTSIVPTNIYGPNDNYNLEDSHVIPGLMHKCMIAKKEGKPFTIMGSGKPLRQFIYSEDLAELIIWTMLEYHSPEPIILSVDEQEEVSIGELARMVANAMEFTGEIVFDTAKSDGQFKKTASNAKLRSFKPDYKFTPIEEGLQKAATWFIENYDKARK
mmetsp:Transcript_10676/g.26143  ORF Transcript_10676/g.26143 Transcript_10676/m.26143 type:complete len:336 (+) Transcript_10676:423-1430(+)|eukprot:g10077.t1